MREIRALPGLEDFMRGPTFEALMKTASTYPVVVLIAKDEECHALILRSANEALKSVLLQGVTASTIEVMIKHNIRSSALQGSTMDSSNGRAMRAGQPREMLCMLWWDVVKPVLNHLGLKVKLSALLKTRGHR
jgi:hypothetical protein